MKLRLCTLLAIPCLAAFMTVGATTAHADTFAFAVTVSGLPGFAGGGTLTAVADPNIADAFDITSVSGYLNGKTVSLLPCATYDPNNPCQTSGNEISYVNLLYPDGIPPLNILFLGSMGLDLGDGVEGVFFASSTHFITFITNLPHDNGRPATFSLVPEPSSFILLGTGLLGIVGTIRRRIRS